MPGEPVSFWIDRITAADSLFSNLPSITDIMQLHYRYRFHSQQLDEKNRKVLGERVPDWLKAYELAVSRSAL